MIKSKKSQDLGHILMYLIGIIILSLIIMYGYNAINRFRDQGDALVLVKFKNDIEKQVTKMGGDPGSISREIMEVPTKYKEVCFIDLDSSIPPTFNRPSIEDSWNDNVQKNIYLVDKDSNVALDSLYIEDISLDSCSFICYPVTGGRIKILLKGAGETTIISTWDNSC